jgi:hypothetical protein
VQHLLVTKRDILSHQHGFSLPKRQRARRIKALSNGWLCVLNRGQE